MTSFNTLFNRMFQEKSRTVYLIYLIQAFASLCFSVWMIISMKGDPNVMVINGHHEVTNHLISYLLIFGVMMFITSFFANFVYWIISSIKNEKINRSQTWRLIPISDTKFLLSNFGTAFISYLWLMILEGITVAVTYLPVLTVNEVRKNLADFFSRSQQLGTQDWWGLLGALVLVILLGYAWYAIVSLINLSSRSIMDFLPNGSSEFIMFIVRVVIILAIIWLLSKATTVVFGAIGNFIPFLADGNKDLQMSGTLVEFLLFDLVVTLIAILLLNKFVEAKQN
ncbi:ABC transporter permease [Lactobacillus helveticus]|uniref:ABC transporter permease n=1 Tax=Lactobacillus TaxID=1578 RepID=UPI0015626BB6|nr:ABC transporter permease [Lactobacillus helveticus]MDN5584475.1 ABC transporter permease [Lactobacillus sp.]MCO0806377.1 ABC transporter permease [Lactobacillus helveticus]MCP9316491.1 ABC transporter permease [Lactobacillus helveticus]MDH5816736.1 ABC transporter permease [Lactobacillus helveticus]MDN6023868.1 ABC transporter permease [Lactobacillus sp.]